jgi:hypothetical protein
MNAQDAQIKLTEMLEENELLIGKLYKRFSEQFEDHRSFWTYLSLLKTDHAALIRSLRTALYSGTLQFKEFRFNSKTIQTFIEYVRGVLSSNTSREDGCMGCALETAWYLEWASMGQGFFRTSKRDPEALREVLRRLSSENRENRRMLMKTLKKTRSSSEGAHRDVFLRGIVGAQSLPGSYSGLADAECYPFYPYGV